LFIAHCITALPFIKSLNENLAGQKENFAGQKPELIGSCIIASAVD
jgi:hypothetical protein